VLGNLSSVYALFEVAGELLRPVEVTRLDRFDDDLITIQKYQGKTNEHFTKLLLNVTLLASEHAREHRLSEAAVVGGFCWVLGRIVGAAARDGRGDLEQFLAFMARQLRQAAVGEMSRRAYTLQ